MLNIIQSIQKYMEENISFSSGSAYKIHTGVLMRKIINVGQVYTETNNANNKYTYSELFSS